MDLHDLMEMLRRRWLSVTLIVFLTLAVAASATLLVSPRYTATTRIFFAVQGGESGVDLAQGSTYAEKQMTSYAEVATSLLVLGPVIKDLGLELSADELAKSIKATVPVNTVILEISVTDTDAARSQRIANGVGAQLAKVAAGLSPERTDGSEAVKATTLALAQFPSAPTTPNLYLNLLVGLALGLALGVGQALLRRLLDTKIRSEQDIESVTDAAVLGMVPFDAEAPVHPVIMHDDPLSSRSEAIRRLRTNLQFVDIQQDLNSILVTSSLPGEGKTTTAINLAVSIADTGSRVLLVDADLRRPTVAEYLGLEGSVGLTTVLIGKALASEVVQPWLGTTLDILPSGQIPPNPSELLGSRAAITLLKDLASDYDMVIIDSSPLLPVTDAAILSKSVGGTLVVVGVDRIHRPQLRDAMESLTRVNTNVLGVVLNKMARRDSSTYVYYTGYGADSISGAGSKLEERDAGSSANNLVSTGAKPVQ